MTLRTKQGTDGNRAKVLLATVCEKLQQSMCRERQIPGDGIHQRSQVD
jgi:hypothetical protein